MTVFKCHTNKEFCDCQKYFIKKGYSWIDSNIFNPKKALKKFNQQNYKLPYYLYLNSDMTFAWDYTYDDNDYYFSNKDIIDFKNFYRNQKLKRILINK